MSIHIAVDIGGTRMRAACYRPGSHTPVRLERISTRAAGEKPLERLKMLVASVWPSDEPVLSIGVAAPGPLDPFTGEVLEAPNIPGWVNLPLRRELEERFETPVVLGNDANLAALGEWRFGAGQGHLNLVYLTISTGIGGGVICDGHLLIGQRGLAAELGHITVDTDGPMCGCGQRGHLEAVAAGPAISAWVQSQIEQGAQSVLTGRAPLTAEQVAAAAREGDSLSQAAFRRAGNFIGHAVADYLHIFNPSIVIFGGGVSQSGDLLLDPVRKAIPERVLSTHYLDNLQIVTAQLGDQAGLMGALALARELRPAGGRQEAPSNLEKAVNPERFNRT